MINLRNGEHLGDAIDYTCYVIAWLTRDNPHVIANFDLDSNRGYRYLCWDWIRSKDIEAIPDSFKNNSNNRAYNAPLRPAAGWCNLDIPSGTPLPPEGDPNRPTKHDVTKGGQVRIRYIDKEEKFQ